MDSVMETKKYRIIIDYGAVEGMKFLDDIEHQTIDEAVKKAVANSYASPFLIVQVVDWKATI
jgi:hypothetical protein